ncbi:MAG: UPF0182 family protein [Deltaproteobacteria bacterium]|nr:UPF0182 family protein [Deltaproteobacteria bacterium]MBW1952925.1 UPF0182 family protein [Deltaproteobacteria bacterium]MBW1987473.1 UPF0182 family protein [Deltaproteobacteria bacterium]MBW2135326.1 UPF0182 family protein [Deltaproteobacteria bacterium]
MPRWKRWLLLLISGLMALGLLYVVLTLIFIDFIVDLWWFQALGYGQYFWLRFIYRYLIFGLFTLLFFMVFFLNFWVASRFLGATTPSELKTSPREVLSYKELAKYFRAGSLKVYTPFSLLLAIILALPLFRHWESTLLFFFGPVAGVQDPVFGKDISYYLFTLPVYLLVADELLIIFGLLSLSLLLLYWLDRRYLATQDQRLAGGAKTHLSVLVLLLFLLAIWNFILQRYQLLYSSAHESIFYGPGYVEMYVILPLIWVCIALLLVTGLALVYYIQTRRGLKLLIATGVILALALVARYSSFLPDQVQQYIVRPNEISRETPFMAKNIQATLAAYDLETIETRDYQLEEVPWDRRSPEVRQSLVNIPVWDREVLNDVYSQLQELRTYYDFTTIDVDRYNVKGSYQQVFLSPRELNLKGLPPGVQNWFNKRLKYTHGIGVVMTPAAQAGEEPMTWFIKDIPPTSEFGFDIEQPSIYYGAEKYGPAIAPNDSREIGYPTATGHQLIDYQGRGGVSISSFWRKLIFSIYFKERDILFTTKTNPKSRILFRRQIVERIKAITPFFILDEDPYIVVTSKRIYWIQDAYTFSDRYPYAYPYNVKLNYIRNAVKIVVDAYDGTVNYYLADPRDPIIQAYSRIYPGLLKNLNQLPAELKSHLRYPKDMFDIQMEIYARYHQTDPEVFYKQEDIWEFPKIQQGDQTIRMRPYYLTLNLIDKDKSEFILLCPMNPMARDNLRALCVVGCDGPNYGRMLIYSFPKGTLVYGPSQVDAFIDQDTLISEQFSLWSMIGSKVERGRMIVLPLRGAIYYIQPVYLKAAARLKIPQLKRLIVSKGEITVMEPTLQEGFEKLDERFRVETERLKRRLQPAWSTE